MLVTFRCNAYENITMFGDVALRLLTMMGQSDAVPSALLAEDVSVALVKLKQALDQETHLSTNALEDDDETPDVSLAHRALPLIKLLHAAARQKCDVMWG